MPQFSVILLTASPSMQGSEAGGAFVKIDGRECLLRSVELFLNRENVKQIQLIVNPESIEEAKKKYGGHLAFSGVKLVPGGPQWFDQLAAGAEKLAPESTHVLIHDAARPILAYADIDEIMAEAENHPIVALITPLRANLVGVSPAGKPVAFHTADEFMQIVTPWVYQKSDFLKVVETRHEPAADAVTLLKGSPLNFRVATPSDASLAKAMLALLPKRKMRPADNPFDEAQW